MRFLICHSNPAQAKEEGLPLAGSVVEVATLEDLLALQASCGHKIIIHPTPEFQPAPWWAQDVGKAWWTAQDAADRYAVSKLPDDWHGLRWIEIAQRRWE